MKKRRLTWRGNIRAQEQADAAWLKLKDGQRAKAKKRKRRKPTVFRGTYYEYLDSARWRRKRQKAFRHYGRKCCRCGATADLHVHHRHYRTLFRESVLDLEVLCGGCHRNAHEGAVAGIFDPMTTTFLNLAKSF